MLTPYEKNTLPVEIATADDACKAAFVKLKRAYQNYKWEYDALEIIRQQIGMYKPEWILSACDDVIGTQQFYHVSHLRKCCLDYAHNERVEAAYNEPDPFPLPSDTSDPLGKALGAGGADVNRKLLRAQLAYMAYQRANGIGAPKKIPFRSKEHDVLKARIAECDGVPFDSLGRKVAEIIECATEPLSDD